MRSPDSVNRQSGIREIAVFTAAASALQIAESFIPGPVPGIKLGLANVVVITALLKLGFRAAFEIAVLRVLISSLLLGTFLSPAFFLSLSGSLASTLVMGAVFYLNGGKKHMLFGVTGISLAGAAAHNIAQVSLVYAVFVGSNAVFFLLPVLGISAVVTGFITGAIAQSAAGSMEKKVRQKNEAGAGHSFKSREIICRQWARRVPAAAKITAVTAVLIYTAMSKDLSAPAAVFASVTALFFAAGIRPAQALKAFLRSLPFLMFAFAAPLLTGAGPEQGALNALRIASMLASALLLIGTTSAVELASGIELLMRPLKIAGISGARTAAILALTLDAVPAVFESSAAYIKERIKGKIKISETAGAVTGIFNAAYATAENIMKSGQRR